MKKIKLHDHSCPENWIKLEKLLNQLLKENRGFMIKSKNYYDAAKKQK